MSQEYGTGRLSLAQRICSSGPPLVAQRIRDWLYPFRLGQAENTRVRRRAITGSILDCSTADYHGYRCAVQGYFEWRNAAICAAVCRPGDTVIEVGANVGTETACFADIVGPTGRVYAFEPDPDNFQELAGLVQINSYSQVILSEKAVSSTTGIIYFHRGGGGARSGVGHITKTAGDSTIEVAQTTLDSLLEPSPGNLQAIFMDVEGYEPAVLDGAKELLKTYRPVIVLEASPKLLHRSGSSLRVVERMLSQLGWEAQTIGRFGLERTVDVDSRSATNWFCFPLGRRDLRDRVQRQLFRAGWLPAKWKLNPLCFKNWQPRKQSPDETPFR